MYVFSFRNSNYVTSIPEVRDIGPVAAVNQAAQRRSTVSRHAWRVREKGNIKGR